MTPPRQVVLRQTLVCRDCGDNYESHDQTGCAECDCKTQGEYRVKEYEFEQQEREVLE